MLPGKAMIVVVSQTPYVTLVDFAKEQMARRQNSPTPSTSTALFDRSWLIVIIACLVDSRHVAARHFSLGEPKDACVPQ